MNVYQAIRDANEHRLERTDEGVEEVEQHALAAAQGLPAVGVDDAREDERRDTVARRGCVDLLHCSMYLFRVVREGQRDPLEDLLIELREQGVHQGVDRDARAIGDQEYRALH